MGTLRIKCTSQVYGHIALGMLLVYGVGAQVWDSLIPFGKGIFNKDRISEFLCPRSWKLLDAIFFGQIVAKDYFGLPEAFSSEVPHQFCTACS